MKLATLNDGSRDGCLIVVSKNLKTGFKVESICPSLIVALENWGKTKDLLESVYTDLNNNNIKKNFRIDSTKLLSPLPRCYQWLDGSAYLSHVKRVRKARNAQMPDSFLTDPLMYQGNSDSFLSPYENLPLIDEEWGADFESEVAIITDDTPMNCSSTNAKDHICLLMLVNDYSLRNLIPAELAKGFGFIHGKPSGSFSPVAVTPDELGDSWKDCKIHLPVKTWLNDNLFGEPNAGKDMQFGFDTLVSHASKTRSLSAGTIIGSGTVSNEDESVGASCLVEKRVIEIAKYGETRTPFLRFGDKVKIEMCNANGDSIFGAIEQKVTKWIK